MPESDLLTIIAEIALGVAGFSGVIVAIGPKKQVWQTLDKYRIITLLLNVFLVIVFSLIPLGLYFAIDNAADAWFFSSMLYLLAAAHVPFRNHLMLKAAKTYEGFSSAKIFYFMVIGELAAITFLLLNVLVFRESWPHILALGLWLLYAFMIFSELLIISMQSVDSSA